MKKKHWFSLGFPILTLFLYGIGAFTSPHYITQDGSFVSSPYFLLAVVMFSIYGFIMFVWEAISYIGNAGKGGK